MAAPPQDHIFTLSHRGNLVQIYPSRRATATPQLWSDDHPIPDPKLLEDRPFRTPVLLPLGLLVRKIQALNDSLGSICHSTKQCNPVDIAQSLFVLCDEYLALLQVPAKVSGMRFPRA
jgi:hypothetical protein